MTMQQPKALRLAEKLRDMCVQFDTPSHERGVVNGAIHELRSLQERLEASKKSNADWATRTHALEAVNAKLRAEIDELQEQMAAIGAGGVEPLRKRAAIVSDAQIKEGMTDLKPYVYQATRALLATGGQAQAVKLLAADHSGMKVDYRGLFSQVQRALKRTDPGHAEMLRQLEGHLQELGQRWYAGDTAVVDELLQLYSVEYQARDALAAQAKQGGAQQ